MNLLFKVVYAAHANGTHHKLALDALRYLECDQGDAWRAVFLKHVEAYLDGAKAPDKEFKDFKNHVLHVRDNYWGGAPEKAESWYRLLVRALSEENFPEAVWCAGVLSHYYTDPIHPFHTAQSEAESNIHRAVEWSISKSYNELRPRGLQQILPQIAIGDDDAWLKDMVIAGAEYANLDYETLIARYDFDVGVVDPPAGLDEASRDMIGRLLVYASCGFALILDRAIAEARVAPPKVTLTLDTFLATLKTPLKWVTRKMSDATEARLVEAMYDELQATGRVDATLSEDDRAIRDLHATEVLAVRTRERDAERARRRRDSPLPQGNVALADPVMSQPPARWQSSARTQDQANDQPTGPAPAEELPAAEPKTAQPGPAPASVARPEPPITSVPITAGPRDSEPAGRPDRIYLQEGDPVEAAPSIGPKTAARLEAVGIYTVADLMAADPETVAAYLSTRHITANVIEDWRDQARLVMEIPGLRGTHAQLFVGAGLRSTEDIALADPTDVMTAMLAFVGTHEGQRVLRDGTPPDLEKVTSWVKSAERVLAA